VEKPDQSLQQGDWVTSPAFMRGALLTLIAGALVFAAIVQWTMPEQPWRLLAPFAAVLLALTTWRVLVVKGVEPAKQVLGVGGLVDFAAVLLRCSPRCHCVPCVDDDRLFSPRVAMVSLAHHRPASMVGADMCCRRRILARMYCLGSDVMLVPTVYLTIFVSHRYRDRCDWPPAAMLDAALERTEASKLGCRWSSSIGTVFWSTTFRPMP
jgi:hypothetical protein